MNSGSLTLPEFSPHFTTPEQKKLFPVSVFGKKGRKRIYEKV
jgi:hypothetical protein